MPYPNEHACRLEDPSKFSSFGRGKRKHDGKEYSIIYGDGHEQAYRYSKDTWTADQARTHCASHGGSFEAAREASKMDIFTADFEVKSLSDQADENKYTFEGYASVFHKEDRVNDVMEPGAFRKTINDNGGKFPIVVMHDAKTIIGQGFVREDSRGLFTRGTLVKGVQSAEDTYRLMKAGVIDGMSFLYRAIQKEYKGSVRHLKEVALGELTVGPRSLMAHPDAAITQVKMVEDYDLDDEMLYWLTERTRIGRK